MKVKKWNSFFLCLVVTDDPGVWGRSHQQGTKRTQGEAMWARKSILAYTYIKPPHTKKTTKLFKKYTHQALINNKQHKNKSNKTQLIKNRKVIKSQLKKINSNKLHKINSYIIITKLIKSQLINNKEVFNGQ